VVAIETVAIKKVGLKPSRLRTVERWILLQHSDNAYELYRYSEACSSWSETLEGDQVVPHGYANSRLLAAMEGFANPK
jgi:hypothetical protein